MAYVVSGAGNVVRIIGQPLGSETITDVSSVVTLTPPTDSAYALIQPSGTSVRFRAFADDADPTDTEGIELGTGSILVYDADLSQIRFIETAASAILTVEYFG